MDNASLCTLIREALHSPERAEVLALAIDQLPEISRYLDQGLLPFYEQALPFTMRDVQRNISRFHQKYRLSLENINCQNPSETNNLRRHFVNWVLMILKRDCYDIRRRRNQRIYSLDEIIGGDSLTILDQTATPTLEGLSKLLEDEKRSICSQLQGYIENDPKGTLRDCHVSDRPEVNCQALLQLRFLGDTPLTLREISERLQSPLQTIKSRLERNCIPLIKEILSELGYA
ncbi:MAG: hypothetical protein HC916_12385 [Coleofasciculaceae cyanobacterium SM2_1_6]|nr:hypothetical protein [Coleofasciculaceae cyanobacterium SM2_1_6]